MHHTMHVMDASELIQGFKCKATDY